MENIDIFVDFEKYCKTCKHKELKGFETPCNDCLDNTVNTNSEKPVYYKKEEKNEKKEG